MPSPTLVTLTGTGVPHPSPGRAGAGTLVRYGEIALQFDAGRGTVLRLAELQIVPGQLTALFVTHIHSDHLVDLPDVAMTRWIQQTLHPESGPLPIVAPEGPSARFARRMLEPFDDDIETRVQHRVHPTELSIDLHTFDISPVPTEVWRSSDGTVVVEAVGVHHEPVEDAVAYRVTTPSAVVVISGDTKVCAEVEELSRGCDLLVHEACRQTALAEHVKGTALEVIFSYHADTVALGELATRADVPHLVLTHLIPQPSGPADEQRFARDIRRSGFTGELTIGRDLTTISIDRSAPPPPSPPLHLLGHETILDPQRAPHLGIQRDETDELTSEFFEWNVPVLPPHCHEAKAAGVREDVDGIDLENVSDLLRPGYLALETGIARSPRGALSIAVLTEWPGTEPEMIDWWFAWHLADTNRYKLWHPQAHLFAQAKYDVSRRAELSWRERYVGNTSWVDEYVGTVPTRLAITFQEPSTIGLDSRSLEQAGYGTVIYAIVADSDHGNELGRLVHAVRRTDDGCEMRSRFIFPPEAPEAIAAPMLDHCWTEMTHLASFLPRLHRTVNGSSPLP